MRGATVCALFVAATLASASAPAQEPPVAGLHGRVLDGRSGAPLGGATVTLEVRPGGLLTVADAGVAGFVGATRSLATDEDGSYRFTGLTRGSYTLRVTRLGYRAITLEVHYSGPADPNVSVGMEVDPVRLEPIQVTGEGGVDPGPSPAGVPSRADPVASEWLRQRRWLNGDSRTLSNGDVAQTMTLGETDLLRALQRLPGVAAADDWSAEPWTRGARWDETRIYFDGLPLYDPSHSGGAITSVNPDLVGALTFHPGVRPVDAGDGAAGVVELTSRGASGAEHLSSLAQVSLVSGRLSIQRPTGDGSGITVSARRTYVDEVTSGEARVEDRVPYRFSDVGGRWDQRLGDSLRFTLSGLSTRDRLLGDISDEIRNTRSAWGNSVLQAALERDAWGLRTRISVGTSRYRADVELVAEPGEGEVSAPTRNRIDSERTAIEVAPRVRGGEAPPWEVGYERRSTEISYDGPSALPYPGGAVEGGLRFHARGARARVWGRVRRRVLDDVEIQAGARIEQWRPDGGRSTSRLEPRLAAAWSPEPEIRVSAAFGRHVQYEQALAGAGFALEPGLVPTHTWILAGDHVPALEADVLTLGAERWLGERWLASARLFGRWSRGHVLPSPDSGLVRASSSLIDGRLGPGWEQARGRALGAELTARRLSGRVTGSASYSWVRSRREVGGETFATPGAHEHVLDATASTPLTSSMTFGATLTVASGAAMTRFYELPCPGDPYCPADALEPPVVVGFAERAGEARGPDYFSLDLHLQKEGRLLGLPFGFFVQVRNVTGHDNPSHYLGSIGTCGDPACTVGDHFSSGMPTFPLLGFWIRM